jgi:hypothetical protein
MTTSFHIFARVAPPFARAWAATTPRMAGRGSHTSSPARAVRQRRGPCPGAWGCLLDQALGTAALPDTTRRRPRFPGTTLPHRGTAGATTQGVENHGQPHQPRRIGTATVWANHRSGARYGRARNRDHEPGRHEEKGTPASRPSRLDAEGGQVTQGAPQITPLSSPVDPASARPPKGQKPLGSYGNPLAGARRAARGVSVAALGVFGAG